MYCAEGQCEWFEHILSIEKERLEVEIVYDEELDVTMPAITDMAEATIPADDDEEVEEQMFAIDETFLQSDLRYKLKLALLSKCAEQEISHHYLEDGNGKERKGQVMVVSDIWRSVEKNKRESL